MLIALAEDDADVREMATLWLEREGFTVHGCEDGRQLIAAVQDGLRPAAFVLDLMMPGLDGIETWTALRSSDVCSPSFLWTASGNVVAPDGLVLVAKADSARLLALLRAVPSAALVEASGAAATAAVGAVVAADDNGG